MLKAWLVGVGILFVLAEFGIWLKQFILPLPIYILGGAFLAIASNYEQGIIGMFRQQEATTPEVLAQTATLIKEAKMLEDNSSVSSLPFALKTSQLDE
ncbi:hypothetical protein I4641_07310 [Waterburya agarophytonicola K14]|uniref:Uncharacterized protein n=1 Tax=Waterburya agarophytonicola KI4 TaxID=2874699 RepID=A0A964FEK6_9CYAN|nr:hypothetical protein [Waterburya agarophytonicola]MCC0176785.1 hypothetical protein [Waterburya agarophytonicola KI4]